MTLFPRPRTERQRQASIALINIVFLTLVTSLLAGSLPPRTDNTPTASVQHGKAMR